ncbi:MAG: DUF5723 family protein [Flammeovirgaceae bacterium]
MKRLLLSLAIVLFSTLPALAQLDLSAFTATGRGGVATTFSTDYQTIGINPANLGFVKSFRDPLVTVGFGEASFTVRAEPLTRKELFNALFTTGENRDRLPYSVKGDGDLSTKEELARRYTNKDFQVNMDAMLFGMSVHLPGHIGVAINVRDRVQLFTRLGPRAANLAFLGANSGYFSHLVLSDGRLIENDRFPFDPTPGAIQPQTTLTENEQASVVLGAFTDTANVLTAREIMAGSRISASWFREFNISVGGRVYDSYNFSLYAGAGYKIIRGILSMDVDVANDATFNENSLSIADGLINFDQFTLQNNISMGDLAFPSGSSRGWGLDFGVTMVIKRNFYVGAAVTNIGEITPPSDGSYRIESNNKVEQFQGHGLDNFSLLSSSENSFAIGGERSPINWQQQQIDRIELPTTVRVGASYEYLKTVHVGIDIIHPLKRVTGNLESTLIGVGGDFRVTKLFRLSSGANFLLSSGSRINIPLGITYTGRKGKYEAGVATKDIFTYFSGAEGSTFSLATGYLRFRLGAVGRD